MSHSLRFLVCNTLSDTTPHSNKEDLIEMPLLTADEILWPRKKAGSLGRLVLGHYNFKGHNQHLKLQLEVSR